MMTVSLFWLVLGLLSFGGAAQRKRERGEKGMPNRDCVKWGSQFAVPLDGTNVEMDCRSPAGRPVCCVAMSEDRQIRGVGYGMEDSESPPSSASASQSGLRACTVSKEYFSSPQELRDLGVAERISNIGSAELEAFLEAGSKDDFDYGTKLPIHVHQRRLNALLSYVTAPESVRNSTAWLDRVKLHMASESVPEETVADREFLSYFEVSKTCGGVVVANWKEWIEPITVAARHPFGFGRCRPAGAAFREANAPSKPRSDVDYVLLKSGKQLYAEEEQGSVNGNGNIKQKKHFLLDAGTSTFDSSLYWFTCAYSQRKIAFDQVFGWEMTTLDPVEYWDKVPPKWLPYWHFHNTPISSDQTAAHSPVRYIKTMATREDFVAFKLDIDHPDTENPLAMDLLKDKELSDRVDEFFFELHFRCEIMTSCGWGKHVPDSLAGLKLERLPVLKYFIELRKRGLRAHIWP